MVTVSKYLADKLVAQNGHYSDDPRVIRIVEYTNIFNGAQAYGIEYQGQLGRYSASEYVRNPKIYWQAKGICK